VEARLSLLNPHFGFDASAFLMLGWRSKKIQQSDCCHDAGGVIKSDLCIGANG
jgi:hypothetical protein